MNVQSQIPTWLQWAWALAGLIIAAGGFVWILGIFWPYLRWSKRMMTESFILAKQTADLLDIIERRIDPLVKDFSVLVVRARKIMDELEPEVGIDLQDVDPVTGKGTPRIKQGKLHKAVVAVERIANWLEPDSDEDPNREPDQGADELGADNEFSARLKANKERRKKDVSRRVSTTV